VGEAPPPPPPVRPPARWERPIDLGAAQRAVETVRSALPYITIGPPIMHYGPAGDVHIDVPLVYHDVALDRVHFDPIAKSPSPKGRPVHAWGVSVDRAEVVSIMEQVLKELRVVDAVEFRKPEDCWVVPLAWKVLIVAHIKVTSDGTQLVPDYHLTAEMRRFASW